VGDAARTAGTTRRSLLRLLVLLCLALPVISSQAAQTFTVGVLPIHSTRVLVERYEPLRAYLERALRRSVRIESAPDFARFQERTLRGDFDLAITAAHFARMAQRDLDFQPLAQFQPDHDALLIYNAERPLATPGELKGRRLAVIDRLAITVMAALRYLDDQGLESDIDYQVVEHRTHASVVQSLVSGLSAAAVTTSQGLLQIPEDMRRKVVVHQHIADIPAFILVAKAGLPRTQADRIRTLLLAFPRMAEGRQFLRQTGYTAIRPAGETVMRRGDAYLKETRKALRP
jgi:phosphonate transport system substrate-binding protein